MPLFRKADRPGPVEPPAAQRIPTKLKHADRCDSCGAQAYVAAKVNGTDLLFCAHHFHRFEDRIRASAAEIVDERWQLSLTDLRLQEATPPKGK